MTDNIDFEPEYRQGEWEHMSVALPTWTEIIEACDRFWNNRQVDHFVYDEDGNITDVVRTNKERVRPMKKDHWVRGVSAKEKDNKA